MGTLEEFGLAMQAIESGQGDVLDVAIAWRIVEDLQPSFPCTAAALEVELERALSQEV